MPSDNLVGSLLDQEDHPRNRKDDAALQKAVKTTRERIADAFSKGARIPARHKPSVAPTSR